MKIRIRQQEWSAVEIPGSLSVLAYELAVAPLPDVRAHQSSCRPTLGTLLCASAHSTPLPRCYTLLQSGLFCALASQPTVGIALTGSCSWYEKLHAPLPPTPASAMDCP